MADGTTCQLFRVLDRTLIYSLANSFPSPAGNGKESAIPLVKLRFLGNFSPTVAGLDSVIITSHYCFLIHYKTNIGAVKFATPFCCDFVT